MKKIDVYFIYNTVEFSNPFNMISNDISIKIRINLFNLDNYDIDTMMKKINNVIKLYPSIKRVNVIFDKKIDIILMNKVVANFHNYLYSFYPSSKEIKLYNVSDETNSLINTLQNYKTITMDPSKTPDTYAQYVSSNVPSSYQTKIYKLSEHINIFPLTRAVGIGSLYDGYFVHIYPKSINDKHKNLFLIGKAITFDSGGLNIKSGNSNMEHMKVDMAGSAIILNTLNHLANNNLDKKLNIHLLIPIVENMIGNTATRPGSIVKSMTNKTVEINNTDAEGRLCIADALDYINIILLKDKNPENCLIVDVATLTGNTKYITAGVSAIAMSNNKGSEYLDLLERTGENVGEYIDTLKLRREYDEYLKSTVADIKNTADIKSGCISAAVFIKYFVNNAVPWVHIDLASSVMKNEMVMSYGINLMCEFIKNINITY